MRTFFLSYAGIDRSIATQIAQGLQGAGVNVCWDPDPKVGLCDGQLNVKCRALAQFTLDAYFSLMGCHGIFDDFEA
jgi:hypothetical protein